SHGITVFFGWAGLGHQVRGSYRVSASSKQAGKETRAGGMPYQERMETLRKCERLLDWRARHVQGQEPVRGREVRRQFHQRRDDLRGLRVPAGGGERRREADAKDHVEWVLLD